MPVANTRQEWPGMGINKHSLAEHTKHISSSSVIVAEAAYLDTILGKLRDCMPMINVSST